MQPCCEKPENRSEPKDVDNGLTVQACTVCGRRHFELAADSARLGLKGAGV